MDITETANLSKRTFYLHFTDKESVIEALALQRFQELRTQVEVEEPSEETFREAFLRITQTIFEYADNNPELMRIIFGRGGSFRLQTMAREFMARAWEENMDRKCNYRPDAPVPPGVLANAVAGIIHQLLCWWFQHPNDYTPADMATMCTSVLYDSIEVNFDDTIPMKSC